MRADWHVMPADHAAMIHLHANSGAGLNYIYYMAVISESASVELIDRGLNTIRTCFIQKAHMKREHTSSTRAAHL